MPPWAHRRGRGRGRAFLSTGRAATGPALAACDGWVALASNFTSFLILSSVFIVDGELEAAACYAAGLAGSLILLVQARWLGGAPTAVVLAALLLAGGGTAVNVALLRASQTEELQASAAWRLWRGVLGATGFAMLPQVFYLSVVLPASGAPGGAAAAASWGPAAAGLALFAGLALELRAGRLPRSCWELWDVPAWTATLLFMLEPLAALASAALDPSVLASASPASHLLAALVTGLQVPRALLVGEHMWATGTSWSTAFACLQAALVAAATWHALLASALTALPVLGAAWLLHGIAAAEGHTQPLQPIHRIAAVYKQQLRPWQQLAARLRSTLRRQRATI
ncbi:maltose excess chloroplastic-like [Chlorella sorokiniana]|uniref:Maltose excess chloroplastic-like n=1 Tax=Chlorella sorokiniana TaxID=3076 RepID=A0A2P6TDN0_CHLSO|nr:maltose excess chloroplastic-like [Chlorella sorokiniana]|eukprot:PRW20756.1 maltose excess chloroplastic-like [Chlorella sorokiniana]